MLIVEIILVLLHEMYVLKVDIYLFKKNWNGPNFLDVCYISTLEIKKWFLQYVSYFNSKNETDRTNKLILVNANCW